MSRRQRGARQSYHPPYAAQARSAPGTWLRVRTYDTAPAASFIARMIRDATHPAYRDGGYLADIRRAGDGYALWISYQPPETP